MRVGCVCACVVCVCVCVCVVCMCMFTQFLLTCSSSTLEVSDEMATMKQLLNKQEKDANSYKKKYQKQSQQLKATEDQLNSIKKVLKQKVIHYLLTINTYQQCYIQDEVITQLSEVEPWQRCVLYQL